MIKGKQKENTLVDKNKVLEKITTYDIYRYYQGPFKLNEVCVNKWRGEKDPSLIIGTKVSGGLTHKDFGDYSWRGDAFQFVEQIFKCDFPTALRIINKDFNLGLTGGKLQVDKPIITWQAPEIEIKRAPLFHVTYYSKHPKRSLDYWAKLGQGEDDLKRENIYWTKDIWRNRRKLAKTDLLEYAYYYPTIDKWKIYRPFAPKKELKTPVSQWKWDSNVPFNFVDNIDAIRGDCIKAILAKSKKDRMVQMKALQTDCIADVQAEDPACLSDQVIEIFEQIPTRYVISDNDKKGKEFSWWLTKEHGFKHVNVPDKYLNDDPKCTDFADLCYYHGMDKVIEHFKKKGL